MVIPDQPGEQAPLPVAEDEPVEIKPAQTLPEANPNTSADGGEPAVPPQPKLRPTQPRQRLRAAIRAIYQPPPPEAEPEFEPEEISFYRAEAAPAQPANFSSPPEEAILITPNETGQPGEATAPPDETEQPPEPPALLQEDETVPAGQTTGPAPVIATRTVPPKRATKAPTSAKRDAWLLNLA